MTELKPCPFCGGEAILETVDGNSPEECYIYCPECDFESGVYSEPKFIVEKWNRRAENGNALWAREGARPTSGMTERKTASTASDGLT
jgi:Lar family restriction alleviation protein